MPMAYPCLRCSEPVGGRDALCDECKETVGSNDWVNEA